MTKVLFLIFTVLFSASVLADCCNFEVETSVDQCSTIKHDQNDHCGDESQHTESQHCHCSPLNHFKVLPENKIVMTPPSSKQDELGTILHPLLISHFESLIFHPPIA